MHIALQLILKTVSCLSTGHFITVRDVMLNYLNRFLTDVGIVIDYMKHPGKSKKQLTILNIEISLTLAINV